MIKGKKCLQDGGVSPADKWLKKWNKKYGVRNKARKLFGRTTEKTITPAQEGTFGAYRIKTKKVKVQDKRTKTKNIISEGSLRLKNREVTKTKSKWKGKGDKRRLITKTGSGLKRKKKQVFSINKMAYGGFLESPTPII